MPPKKKVTKKSPKVVAKTPVYEDDEYFLLFDTTQLENSRYPGHELKYAFQGIYATKEDAIKEWASIIAQNNPTEFSEKPGTEKDLEDSGWKIMEATVPPKKPKAATKAKKSKAVVKITKTPKVVAETKATKKPKAKATKKSKATKSKVTTKPKASNILTLENFEEYVPNWENAKRINLYLTWQPRINVVNIEFIKGGWSSLDEDDHPIGEIEDQLGSLVLSLTRDQDKETFISQYAKTLLFDPELKKALGKKLVVTVSTGEDS